MTAKEWKDKNPNFEGNMKDYANILQLVILVNKENRKCKSQYKIDKKI